MPSRPLVVIGFALGTVCLLFGCSGSDDSTPSAASSQSASPTTAEPPVTAAGDEVPSPGYDSATCQYWLQIDDSSAELAFAEAYVSTYPGAGASPLTAAEIQAAFDAACKSEPASTTLGEILSALIPAGD